MKLFLTFSFLFASSLLFAQKTFPVGGKLKNAETKELLVGATIFVLTLDSTIAAGAISDAKGEFTVDLNRGVHY